MRHCHCTRSYKKHDPVSALLFIFFITIWLKAKLDSVHTVILSMCVVTKKRKFIETILVITILLTCCQHRSRRERIITVLWVLVWCLLHSRHVRITQKEQINNHRGSVYRVTVPPRIRQSSCRLFSLHAPHVPCTEALGPSTELSGTVERSLFASMLLPCFSLSFSLFLSSPLCLYH